MRRTVTIAILLSTAFLSFSQDTLSYAEQLRAIEEEMDSLSIFNLIDSLFNIETSISNELNVRVGVTTSVTSAGRDYNLNQSGVSSGITFYHKKGFYGDLSGYWNSGVEPHYNPTVLSIGYLGNINPKWSYSFDYEKWFFNPNDSSENPLRHSVASSLSYDFNFGYASIDYSFLFGSETAHRLIGNLTGTINLGKWWVFRSVNIYPSFNMMYGNADITQLRVTREQLSDENKKRLQLLIEFSELTREQKIKLWNSVNEAFENGRITERKRDQYRNLLINSNQLTEEEKQELQTLIEDGIEYDEYLDGNQFGLLNYAFTIPISFSTNRWNILLSYTYSIPVKLPDEFFEVDPIGYFGASVSYRIPFK
ncbi:hypothetical protein SAMN05421640_1257 [Ekhidna lutea]|uniref:MetA-pathway of phenol degradation n=1 Tax=Ekhidna lutea TaxID=447679 RepID=A0A239HEX7_EKHLU|nr:hypothetical protein [Ekhidna lutea]SNS79373.1 hypothetical protein SAMN05421640_1257 [Ekhidna lutea]